MKLILEKLKEIDSDSNFLIQNEGTIFENKVKKILIDITTKDNKYINIEEAFDENINNLKFLMLKNQFTSKKIILRIIDIEKINVLENLIEVILKNGKIENLAK